MSILESREVWRDYRSLEDRGSARTGTPLMSAGISLSNSPHIGHLREFFVANSAIEYLNDKGVETRFIAVADDLDPLKKLYTDMPASFEEFVGQPLINVPDYTGEFELRVEKNLFEVQQALATLDITPTIIRSSELYATPEMEDVKEESLRHAGRIALLLSEITGSEAESNKGIMNISCPRCAKINTQYSIREGTVATIFCYACQYAGEVDVLEPVHKLRWRVDWPARWKVLGVDIEPVAENHATKGGSFDSARSLASDIYGIHSPIPLHYKWARYGSGVAIRGSEKPLTAYEASKRVAPVALRSFFGSHRNGKVLTVNPDELLSDAMLTLEGIDKVPDRRALTTIYRLKDAADIPASKVAKDVFAIDDENVLSIIDASDWVVEESEFEIAEEYRSAAKQILNDFASLDWAENDDDMETQLRELFATDLNRRQLFQALYACVIGEPSGPRLIKLLRVIGGDGIRKLLK